jgi:hypothetical protein
MYVNIRKIYTRKVFTFYWPYWVLFRLCLVVITVKSLKPGKLIWYWNIPLIHGKLCLLRYLHVRRNLATELNFEVSPTN